MQDGYIQSPKEFQGKNVKVACAGAALGFKDHVGNISEISDREIGREDIVTASTDLVAKFVNYIRPYMHIRVYIANIIHEAKEEEAKSKRTLTFYNQLAVSNIPFRQGDSGACVYIIGGQCEKGCLGMAIADLPGGGCVVTPMATLLDKLDLI